ncbi:hypothetical protein PV08_10912 [Exophiala spinifera]|uniref:DUF1330 domain-containing protein n=1 Tax=Exophiala spinifera TaxID=91928 RepID=A0A0D2AYV1_9EURO|nr:uncharacterized protein PV08_10912 [Exophiala spinifera]KIW11610.1 hypothetical protein PV08_10912 [Exophiala spinifera]
MGLVEIKLVDLAEPARLLPEDKPVVLVNLIKFKAQATYPEGSPHTAIPGREAYYTRYVATFSEISASLASTPDDKFKPLYLGNVVANMLAKPYGGDESFDMVGIIQYRNFGAFRKVIESKEYEERALPHRLASIEDYRLYVATEMSV